MVQDCEDEESNHEHDRSWGCGNSKESDETNLSNVDTSEKMLESTRVYQALGINVAVGDEENVVSVREVEQGHSDCRKAEDEGSNAGVGNTFKKLARKSFRGMRDVPMTAMLANTGRVLPHEMALKLAHFMYIFLGVPVKNLYRILKMTKPTTCERTPDAIVKPWTMKYEM